MQYRWAGQLCMTRGDLSIMREIDDNLFTACCQNGLGVARGTFTGIAAANLVMGQKNALTDFFANKPLPRKNSTRALIDYRRKSLFAFSRIPSAQRVRCAFSIKHEYIYA